MLEDYRLEEVDVPEVGEEELLVKVLAVGICAGDAKCFAGAPYFWGEILVGILTRPAGLSNDPVPSWS